MKNKRNRAKYIVFIIVLIILFSVNLDEIENEMCFLKTFKGNIKWLNNIVERYSQLFVAMILLIGIIGAAIKLSVSISGVSFAGIEIALKDVDTTVKNKVRNYLNTKRSLFYIKPKYDNFCEVFTSYLNP